MYTIPQPKSYGPLGHLPHIDAHNPIQSLMRLATQYGPIYRLHFSETSALVISSGELVADACDESRFDKLIGQALTKLRVLGGDGLFTAYTDEPNWRKAHNILLSSFSQYAMEGYHSMMLDTTSELIQKWQRLNPNERVSVPEDMTRLTFDTIGLCGFTYRFNNFYHDQPHPFVVSMTNALKETLYQLHRLPLQDALMVMHKYKYKKDIQTMFAMVDTIIRERKADKNNEAQDLLASMLKGRDSSTGETLDDENIRYQIITFLIAGHETTSGLLSFALYFLLKNPEMLQKAYIEVDHVLTEPNPLYQHVRDLKYIRMILQETLRLWPPVPVITLYPKQDTLLAGKYSLKKRDRIMVLIPSLHRDPAVWGTRVDKFIPERFVDPSKIPQNVYKPFGNGQRACIGQQFAMHEATLILGMILKHFELIDDKNYQLKVQETLTLKPEGFTIKVIPRTPKTAEVKHMVTYKENQESKQDTRAVKKHAIPFLALYGSNLGTAELIARQLTDAATQRGFTSKVGSLDMYREKLPKQGVVVIVTSSYNGKAPDNAFSFVDWLEKVKPTTLKGVRYAVFGCGDSNWADTYQHIPRFIDTTLAAKGATRLTDLGEGDASDDFGQQFDTWQETLWQDLMETFELKNTDARLLEKNMLTITYTDGAIDTPTAVKYNAYIGRITENRELESEKSGRSTRHIEIALPDTISYLEGDHLAILPQNSSELVQRVLRRYSLRAAAYVVLGGKGHIIDHLPLDKPISIAHLLRQYVELQEPATRSQIKQLASSTQCPPHKNELVMLVQEEMYREEIFKKRVSLLDLLEKYRSCELSFENFLELLPPLKPRYYSVSSSPRVEKHRTSITVRVVHEPAWSGNGEYNGIASSYLAQQKINDSIVMFLETPQSGFQLPESAEMPIIMVGPGTGVAPFRGFLQARRALQKQGVRLGEAHLYFGCRNPEDDYLYRNELEQYQKDGLVTLHVAFSRVAGKEKTYVQDLMRKNSTMLLNILDHGGKLYICGEGGNMLLDVEAILSEAYGNLHAFSKKEATAWLNKLQREGRYAKDVWVS